MSPFVDNEAEGHVPEYAEAIERLKAAERKDVLPLPGMGKEDLDDPHSLLGIIDRAEAIEAAKKKQKVYTLMDHDQFRFAFIVDNVFQLVLHIFIFSYYLKVVNVFVRTRETFPWLYVIL